MRNEYRPIIGLTADVMTLDGARRHTLRDSYVSAILNAGGAPVLIPCTDNEEAALAVYRCLDGLVLTGGGDVDPALYGEGEDGTEMNSISPWRDTTELKLTQQALADDLPVLGICRGHQVLNVAAGGTLYQDIPGNLPPSSTDHRGSTYTLNRGLLTHSVRLEPSCKLAAILGTPELMVNSLHHQGVKLPGQGLRVVGASPDGMAEALESEQHRWVMSVQWHPEELWRKQPEAASLFKAFVDFVKAAKEEKQLVRA